MTIHKTCLRNAVVFLSSLAVCGSFGCAKLLKQAALVHPVVHKVFSVPRMDTAVSGAAWTNSVGEGTNTIMVLHLSGTNYYSLGYHQGRLLGPQIKDNIDHLFAAIDKAFVEKSPLKFTRRTRQNLYNEALKTGWKIMAPYVPRAELEEMRGMADGIKAAGITGITLDDLHHVMAKRNNEYAYGIGDGTGGAYGLITSREQCKIFPVNAFSEIDYGKAILPQFKDVMYAGHDSQKQCKLVEQMTGTFDLEKIKQMTRQIAMKSNLHVVIYDLTTGDMWIANRRGKVRAADSEYVKFPFSMWELPKIKENPAGGIAGR